MASEREKEDADHVVTLGFLSHQEAQRFLLFLSHLIQWVRLELPSLLGRTEDDDEEENEENESVRAAESVIQQQFALSLRHQINENVHRTLPLARSPQNETLDPLTARYAKKVPRVFILLARKLVELEGYKQEGAFRHSAEQDKRDKYLRWISMVGLGRVWEVGGLCVYRDDGLGAYGDYGAETNLLRYEGAAVSV